MLFDIEGPAGSSIANHGSRAGAITENRDIFHQQRPCIIAFWQLGGLVELGLALGDARLMFSSSDPALHGSLVEWARAVLTIGLRRRYRAGHGLTGRRVPGRLQKLPGLLHRQTLNR